MTVVSMDQEGQRLLSHLPDWLPEGAPPAVLVTLWSVEGSAPRNPGARLLCRAGRLLAGTIGGGHLEEEALREAGRMLAAAPRPDDDDAADWTSAAAEETAELASADGGIVRMCRYALGSQLGQCCGGRVWLHFQQVTPAQARELAAGLHAALATGGELRTVCADQVLCERPEPPPSVLIFGAGHVGTALARVLQPLPWRLLVVDHRPQWADRTRMPPGVEVVCIEPLRLLAAWGWLGATAQASQMAQRATAQGRPLPPAPKPACTRALVMTHDHALDRDLTEALLRLPQALSGQRLGFVGLIGSAAKIAVTRQRLRQRGVVEAMLDALHAPIGLRLADDTLLGNKQPGQIAISVAAQLLALEPR